MANIERKDTTVVTTTYNLTLTPEEASGLYRLLNFGTTYTVLTKLGILSILHVLNNSDVDRTPFLFGQRAEILVPPVEDDDEDYDDDYNDHYTDGRY